MFPWDLKPKKISSKNCIKEDFYNMDNNEKEEKGVIAIAFQSIEFFFIGLIIGGVIVYFIMK